MNSNVLTAHSLFLAAFLLAVGRVEGNFDLLDGNSLVQISENTDHGMYTWFLYGGIGPIQETQLWLYEDGAGGSIGYLPLVSASMPAANILELGYRSTAGTSVDLRYELAGGSLGQTSSTVNCSIALSNSASTRASLSLFVSGRSILRYNGKEDTMFIDDAHIMRDIDKAGALFAATEVLPLPPDHVEVSSRPIDFFATPPTLSDFRGPIGPLSSGYHYYAYQWDASPDPGATFEIALHQYIGVVPEPSTSVLTVFGILCACGMHMWRRKM